MEHPTHGPVDPIGLAFEALAQKGDIPRLRSWRGVVRFEVDTGADAPHVWCVVVDCGKVQVTPGTGEGDCIVTCHAADLGRIVAGRGYIMAAFLRGDVEITGDEAIATSILQMLQ